VRLITIRMIDIDAQNFAEQFIDILRAIAGVVGRAAIAHANVEKTVRTELDHAAVMIGERLRDGEQYLFCSVSYIRIRRRHLIFGNHRSAVRLARIINEETVISGKLRMKSQAQKPALAAR